VTGAQLRQLHSGHAQCLVRGRVLPAQESSDQDSVPTTKIERSLELVTRCGELPGWTKTRSPRVAAGTPPLSLVKSTPGPPSSSTTRSEGAANTEDASSEAAVDRSRELSAFPIGSKVDAERVHAEVERRVPPRSAPRKGNPRRRHSGLGISRHRTAKPHDRSCSPHSRSCGSVATRSASPRLRRRGRPARRTPRCPPPARTSASIPAHPARRSDDRPG